MCAEISHKERPGEDFNGRIAIIDSGNPNFDFRKAMILGATQSDSAFWYKLLTERDIRTKLDANSTNDQIPSAKLFYDTVGDINSALDELHTYAQSLISGGATE